MNRIKFLVVLIALFTVLVGCDVIGIEFESTIEPDGSGDLAWTIGQRLQRDESGNLIPMEDGCQVDEDDNWPGGYTIEERTQGDEYWCTIYAPFESVDVLETFLSQFEEQAVKVNCLGFADDQFLIDVSLFEGLPADTDTSDLRGDEYLMWQLTIPGAIDSHNAHQQAGNTLTWNWYVGGFVEGPGSIQVNIPRDGRCPIGGVQLFLTVEEDGTGSARLTVPQPKTTGAAAEGQLAATLTGAGWSIAAASRAGQSEVQAWRDFRSEQELNEVILAVPGLAGTGSFFSLEMADDEVTRWREYTFSGRIEMTQYGAFWTAIAPEAAPPRFRFDLSLPGTLESSPGGWTDPQLLMVEWEAATGPDRLTLKAVSSRTPDAEEVDSETVESNLETLKSRFLTEIPVGQVITDPSWFQSQLLSRGAQPGSVNNLTNWQEFACGDYQTRVLKWLNDIRLHPDPAVRALLAGLDYGPIEAYRGGHQAVVLFPRGEDWHAAGVVLDPWPKQVPQVFTMDDWQFHFRWGVGPGEGSSQYPHLFGNPSAYPGTVIPAERVHPRRIGVHSPVDVLITASDGRRLGALPDGSLVTEIAGADFYPPPEGDGAREWLFGLPAGDYQVQLTGVGSGQYHVLVGDADGNIFTYGAQPIEAGQQAALAVSADGDHQALATPAGEWVEPILAVPENLSLLDLGEPPEQPAVVTQAERIRFIAIAAAAILVMGLCLGIPAIGAVVYLAGRSRKR